MRANFNLSANLWRMDLLTPTLSFLRAIHILAFQPLALGFSGLGSEQFYLLLLPLVYWLYDRRTGAQLGILVLFSVLLNNILKVAFHLPRPYWEDPSLTPLSHFGLEKSFGFPSGHAQAAFLIWPFLALRSGNPKRWMPFAIALASCISLSRMILGVHWPLDVVGGALIGLLILLGFGRYADVVERFLRSRPHALQLVLCAVFVGLCGALGILFIGRAAIAVGPKTEALLSASSDLTGRCAALLGLLFGLVLAPRDVPIRRSTVRVVVGLVVLGAIYFGLSKWSHQSLTVMFLRYWLATFWVSCAALWMFRKMDNGTLQREREA